MDIPLNEAFSGISGSISLTCWIFLIAPQLLKNYQNHSAEGLSPVFLIVWLLGDICNLAGAIWADLLATVIGIGVYFCGMDAVMLMQVFYYNVYKPRISKHKQTKSPTAQAVSEPQATDPLLPNGGSAAVEPGTDQRRTPLDRRQSKNQHRRRDSLSKAFHEKNPTRQFIRDVSSVVLVILVGTAGWFVAWRTGAWSPKGDSPGSDDDAAPMGAELLGYASSVFYLTARLPQIYLNYKRGSCDGLAVLFFVLSTIGNLTYGGSILIFSLDKNYVVKNAPWLLGSLGTIVEDCVIFAQFHYYKRAYPAGSEAVID